MKKVLILALVLLISFGVKQFKKLFYKYTDISKLKYGLIEFEPLKRQSLWFLLKSPFVKVKQ